MNVNRVSATAATTAIAPGYMTNAAGVIKPLEPGMKFEIVNSVGRVVDTAESDEELWEVLKRHKMALKGFPGSYENVDVRERGMIRASYRITARSIKDLAT